MKSVRIANKVIGEGKKVFIIAEAGVNHNGKVKLAKKLIDAAVEAGADVIKFQTFKAEKLVSRFAPKAKYQKKAARSDESQYEMLKRLQLSEGDFKALKKYADRKRIIFLSTPFDQESVDFLVELGVPALKIGAGEVTNLPLLEYIARKNLPVILSTGMSNLQEVKEAVNSLSSRPLVILHCVSTYPARAEDCNLKAMETLRRAFKVPVGFSDHTLGITVPIAAVALGARVIEKHFTLDRRLNGPDHKTSLDLEELKAMVRGIREVESSLGSGIKKATAAEKPISDLTRRSIVSAVDIPKGTRLRRELLTIKRPGTGIPPKFLDNILGRRVKVKVKKDQVLTRKALM